MAEDKDLDVMGYPLADELGKFTPAEIAVAKALAADAGFEWDVVGTDPRVGGRHFLRMAQVAARTMAGIAPQPPALTARDSVGFVFQHACNKAVEASRAGRQDDAKIFVNLTIELERSFPAEVKAWRLNLDEALAGNK